MRCKLAALMFVLLITVIAACYPANAAQSATPVLAEITARIQRGDAPRAVGRAVPLSARPLPGVEWAGLQVFEFDVRHVPTGALVLMIAGNDLQRSWTRAYIVGGPALTRQVRTPGLMDDAGLLQNNGSPIACRSLTDWSLVPSPWRPGHPIAPFYTVSFSSNRLTAKRIPATQVSADPVVMEIDPDGATLSNPYVNVDELLDRFVVTDPGTGQTLGFLPHAGRDEFEGSDYDYNYYFDCKPAGIATDAVIVQFNPGTESQPPQRFVVDWYTIRKGHRRHIAERTIDCAALRKILPKDWPWTWQIPDQDVYFGLCSDGSVALRVEASNGDPLGEHGELLTASLIVEIKKAGEPVVLAWSLQYSDQPPITYRTGPLNAIGGRPVAPDTAQAPVAAPRSPPDRCWYGASGRTVACSPVKSRVDWEAGDEGTGDMILSLDRYHHVLYYLLQGRLWSMPAP